MALSTPLGARAWGYLSVLLAWCTLSSNTSSMVGWCWPRDAPPWSGASGGCLSARHGSKATAVTFGGGKWNQKKSKTTKANHACDIEGPITNTWPHVIIRTTEMRKKTTNFCTHTHHKQTKICSLRKIIERFFCLWNMVGSSKSKKTSNLNNFIQNQMHQING